MKIHACSPATARYRAGFPAAAYRPVGRQAWHVNTPADQRKTRPAANVIRREDGYTLEIAMPGIPKDQVSVSVHEGFLVVSHQASSEPATGGRHTRKEFDLTGFERRFRLPEKVDVSGIEARFENGILYLTLPEQKPEVKSIEIQ